jgi:hypothetical protein
MRRKLGILFLIGITVLAGTPEAARQFDGLKSSLKNFTRASLWSGLIVYAQPVNDGNLPTPQIYYLMPTPQQPALPAAQQQPVLADNGNNATTAKPENRNNHGGEVAASNPEAATLLAAREIEDAAKSELALNKLPLNLIVSHLVAPPKVAPKLDRVRVYEETANNEAFAARKFKQDADVIARAFVKEIDAAKLFAETERLTVEQAQLEHLKSKTPGETENLHRRIQLRVTRRPVVRPERLERVRVIAPFVEARGIALLEMSSIGCEKTRATPAAAPVPAAPVPAAPMAKTSVLVISESVADSGLPALSNPTGNSWTLNCDTEPEQK